MARKSRRLSRSRTAKTVVVPTPATYAELAEMRAELRQAVADLDALAQRFTTITDIQFERIAQVQAELEKVRSASMRPPLQRRKKS